MKATTTLFYLLSILAMTILVADMSARPVWAGLFDVETKLNASDASTGDGFGYSVAISGNTAIAGAWGDDDAGNKSGSAYLFDVTTGSQSFKLTAGDAAAEDQFGYSTAISGNTAIIGAWGDDDTGSNSGSAYLFNVNTGSQSFKLTPSDPAAEDWFGFSVAISGNTAIVGAWGDDDNGSNSGSAYLFDVATASRLFKLTASDAEAEDWFGRSVAISGNVAIVGAWGDDDAGSASGSAYLFDVTTGDQLFKLTASDAEANEQFGRSVAISGNTAIVGARYGDDGEVSFSGAAYLFDVTSGNQLSKLTATDSTANDQFGESVAISGNTAIVGAWADGDAGNLSGSAYLYDVTTGNQLAKLTASDAEASDHFGRSVAISDSTAIAGAPGDDVAGSAYLFQSDGLDGDFDTDGNVDGADFLVWQRNFGGPGPAGDANHDGMVDGIDLAEWEQNFGTSGAESLAGIAAVPEPSSFILGAFAGFFGLGTTHCRKRK